MSKWIKRTTVSCGTLLRWRANVVECQCPNCKRWCVKWEDTIDYNFCPNCGEDMRNKKKKTAFDDYIKEQLKDPEFRKEFEKLYLRDMREAVLNEGIEDIQAKRGGAE